MYNFTEKHLVDEHGFFSFLGTMAGEQITRGGQYPTYTRKYKVFGGSDRIREKLQNLYWSKEETALFGEHYSFTPRYLRDGRNFGITAHPSLKGGGFFLKIEKTDDDPTSYVIKKFINCLKKCSGLDQDEIVQRVNTYGVNYFLYHFFESVSIPKEGDLVVYPKCSAATKLGIFRETKPNWNSPLGGSVESVWNRFAYQHDVFFVPNIYGDTATFYRLKNAVQLEDLCAKPHDPAQTYPVPSSPSYLLKKNYSFTFQRTRPNIERRTIVDTCSRYVLAQRIPEINYLAHIKFGWVCYAYAFSHLLNVHSMSVGIPYCVFECAGNELLEKYFSQTDHPKQGDLVVYFASKKITHWAIYLSEGRVESKWGQDDVYQHHFFDAPSIYGDIVRCYHLKKELTLKSWKEQIAIDYNPKPTKTEL